MLNGMNIAELNDMDLNNVNGGGLFGTICDWCGEKWDSAKEWYKDECSKGAVSMVLATAGALTAVAGTAVIVTAGVVTVGPAVAVAGGVGAIIGAAAIAPEKKDKKG